MPMRTTSTIVNIDAGFDNGGRRVLGWKKQEVSFPVFLLFRWPLLLQILVLLLVDLHQGEGGIGQQQKITRRLTCGSAATLLTPAVENGAKSSSGVGALRSPRRWRPARHLALRLGAGNGPSGAESKGQVGYVGEPNKKVQFVI